jgi:type IV secretion system protein VirB6
MPSTIVGDVYAQFDRALGGFYAGASQGIAGYVIPVAWVALGIGMLVWCLLVVEGRIASPLLDWLLKLVGFLLVLHAMGGGYLSWVARPIYELPSELVTALSGTSGSAPDLLGQVNEKTVDLVSAMFSAGSKLLHDLAIGAGIAVFLMSVLVVVATYLLLAVALFAIIFSKLGLSLVLAVGPFFLLGLVLPQTRSYFFGWLNTALYFVFYHVFTALFIFMFIGIMNSYMAALTQALGGSANGGGVPAMVAHLTGAQGPALNVAALTLPILLISVAMFFMFLQIPAICASLTHGSGGTMGAGMAHLLQARRLAGRPTAR